MDVHAATRSKAIVRVADGGRGIVEDQLAVEEPIEFRLGTTPIAVLMRTPGADEHLARGFALTEGIILNPGELAAVRDLGSGSEGGRFELVLAEGVDVDPERFRRNLYATSSCGVCGKASIDAVRVAAPPLPPGPAVPVARLAAAMAEMRAHQTGFDVSGGLHAAGAFNGEGTVRVVMEDIGRHNAVDKVVGTLSVRSWPIAPAGLLVSGRVSFEMVQKAAVAGFSIVAGVSAASSLAVELAEELGMTVAGFIRGDECNIYTDPGRIT